MISTIAIKSKFKDLEANDDNNNDGNIFKKQVTINWQIQNSDAY